jgi:RecA/RadA recombinase
MGLKNFRKNLSKMDGYKDPSNLKDIHADVLQTSSPAVNFTFGNGWGLPRGYSMMLFGPPRGGKTILCNDFIGQLHKTRPEAVALKFDTEMRVEGQMNTDQQKVWGIDPERYMTFEVNQADQVFDAIEKKIAAEGVVIIDSLTGIVGRRRANADSINDVVIGDNALTIQEGLKQILGVQRRCNFALIVTSHVRAQLDQTERMRGNVIRPAVSFGTLHHCEYYMYVEENRTKDARVDAEGNEFRDMEHKDMAGRGEKTAHKIRVRITDSSLGPKDRTGQFTLDYKHGIINQYEEIFLLASDRGIFTFEGNTWVFGDKRFGSTEKALHGVKNDPQLQQDLLKALMGQDRATAA